MIIVDEFGNVYFSDSYNNSIRKVDIHGIITTVVGNGNYGYSGDGGLADAAEIDFPIGLSFDTLGNLYFADEFNNVIRKVTGLVTPITLSYFTATKQENNVNLNWQTATEINTSHFNIQRSTNGKDFTIIGSVNAKGASTYSFNDQSPPPPEGGILYYRLEIVDKDGSKTYSEIKELSINHYQLSITPNPAKDIVYITGKAMQHITIMDNAGRVVVNKTVNNVDNTSINIANLAKGVYFISVKDSSGNKQTEKLVVE